MNGAKRGDLYRLLFRKYVVVLGAAFAVSVPVAWYIVYRYTADYVVKAPLQWWMFLAALAVVALLSLGTLSGRGGPAVAGHAVVASPPRRLRQSRGFAQA